MGKRFTKLIRCAKFVGMMYVLYGASLLGMLDDRLSGDGEWWHDDSQILTRFEEQSILSCVAGVLGKKQSFDTALVSMQLKKIMEQGIEQACKKNYAQKERVQSAQSKGKK